MVVMLQSVTGYCCYRKQKLFLDAQLHIELFLIDWFLSKATSMSFYGSPD